MIKLDLKALSVNKSYYWRKTKTQELRYFHTTLEDLLNDDIWIEHFDYLDFDKKWLKLKLVIEFWYSNIWSDIDNWLKSFLDWLSKTLEFNDNIIYELNVKKTKTKKQEEFIKFEIIEI